MNVIEPSHGFRARPIHYKVTLRARIREKDADWWQ